MKPIAIVEHGHHIPPGRLGDVLAGAGVPVLRVPVWAGGALPDLGDVSAVVSLGGLQGAYQRRYPLLAAEKAWLAEAARRDLPVLGICLGSQLLADALGGRAFRAPAAEAAVIALEMTDAGRADPVFSELTGPVLTMHQDTWDPPDGAAVLAATEDFPQAFRLGSVLAVQPHPEAGAGIVTRWMDEGSDVWLLERGGDAEVLLEELWAVEEDAAAGAERFFAAWLEEST